MEESRCVMRDGHDFGRTMEDVCEEEEGGGMGLLALVKESSRMKEWWKSPWMKRESSRLETSRPNQISRWGHASMLSGIWKVLQHCRFSTTTVSAESHVEATPPLPTALHRYHTPVPKLFGPLANEGRHHHEPALLFHLIALPSMSVLQT